MNPYDFVPIDRQHIPERRTPVWHHVLTSTNKLYSGYLSVTIRAETPLFIPSPKTPMQNPDNPGAHIFNNAWEYIIPGSSLKGLLRTVVETLCNGCLKMLQPPFGYEKHVIPQGFSGCQDNKKLCIACRIFGMMPEEQRNAEVFLGKVNIGDAIAKKETLALYEPIYTTVLEAPKPRHKAFYLEADRRSIAGRKFYFHHHGQLNTTDRLLPIRNEPGRYRNQYIEPIDTETEFTTRIDFTNLEADEFAALLLAITLKSDMRHKIGYGKPIGLGSISMKLTELILVDYARRYTTFRAHRGISSFNADQLVPLTYDRMMSFDEQVHSAWQHFYEQPALEQLHNIWKWQPDSKVVYRYPNRDWFNAHPTARIKETLNL